MDLRLKVVIEHSAPLSGCIVAPLTLRFYVTIWLSTLIAYTRNVFLTNENTILIISLLVQGSWRRVFRIKEAKR